MICNFNTEYINCPNCNTPYFTVEEKYVFSNNTVIENGAKIPYVEAIQTVRCAHCGEVLKTVKNANFSNKQSLYRVAVKGECN